MQYLLILLVLISTSHANHRVRRVVDGRKAISGQFPYLVSIQTISLHNFKMSHACGGAIINERYILTAAHCIEGESKSLMSILTGSNSLEKGGKHYDIEHMKMHHKYEKKKKLSGHSLLSLLSNKLLSNDIALIRVSENITFNKETQPIPLASHTTNIPFGSKLTIAGWGSINKHMLIYTENIQYFDGTLISLSKCKNMYKYMINENQLELTANDICTLAPLERGVCDGDSGSPVAYNGTLVGIVSRAGKVCGIGVPDVHTKVQRYKKWIDKTIAQMNKNPKGKTKPKKPVRFYY